MSNAETSPNLSSLLLRVEGATGADAGIDGLIALHIEGWAFHFGDAYDEGWPDMGGHWLPPEAWLHNRSPFECKCRSDIAFDVPPDYTASLDAALALCERQKASGIDAAQLLHEALEDLANGGWRDDQPIGPQIALCLIAAMLRSLIAAKQGRAA